MRAKIKVLFLMTSLLFLTTSCDIVGTLILNKLAVTRLSIQDDRLYILDLLNEKTFAEVKTVLEANPQVKTIVFTANPGSISDEDVFQLGRYIRKKGLNTHLLDRSVIASGAVDLFLSGKKRTIEKGAQLGVHSWSDGFKEATDYPKEHKSHHANATYIKDMLGTDPFYWFTIYAASADKVHWMTEAEIKTYGLMTTSDFLPASHDKTPFEDEFLPLRQEIQSE